MPDAIAHSFMGMDVLAKLDGEIAATAPMEITAWNEWHRGSIDGIVCQPGQTLTVGIYVRAPQGGAWGKIDDASLNRVP